MISAKSRFARFFAFRRDFFSSNSNENQHMAVVLKNRRMRVQLACFAPLKPPVRGARKLKKEFASACAPSPIARVDSVAPG
jgi:hypothetical protein